MKPSKVHFILTRSRLNSGHGESPGQCVQVHSEGVGLLKVRGYPIACEEFANDRGPDTQGLPSASLKAYRVDVSDTGPGILKEHTWRAFFEEYTSYSGPEDRSGGGLGLAICKMILTAHDGQIWAENYSGGAEAMLCVLPAGGNPHARRRVVTNNELRVVAHGGSLLRK